MDVGKSKIRVINADHPIEVGKSRWIIQKTPIGRRMDKGVYPIFVTAGNGDEKLAHIMRSYYLPHSYDNLTDITGTSLTFGFNFDPYETHHRGYQSSRRVWAKDFPKLASVYIDNYSDENRQHIEDIRSKFLCKVKIYDAQTANVWGRN